MLFSILISYVHINSDSTAIKPEMNFYVCLMSLKVPKCEFSIARIFMIFTPLREDEFGINVKIKGLQFKTCA